MQCLDWSNPDLALRSKDLQNLEFIFTPCHNLPSLHGFELLPSGGYNHEALALLEKNCGAIPEGEDKAWYHYNRF